MTPEERRWMAALGALVCGVSVALGAVASHVVHGQAQERLALASLFAFGHGLALVVLSTRDTPLARWARRCFLAGIALFSGSLAAAAMLGTPTLLAPFGGSLLMLGWGILALDFLRTR